MYWIIPIALLALYFVLCWWAARKARREHAVYLADRRERRGAHGFHPDVERQALKQRIARKRRFPWR